MDTEKIKKDVWQTILSMNRLWTIADRPDDLKQFFHKDMVAVTPVDRQRRVGASACVAGWKGFTQAAKIHFWKEIDPLITLFGDGKFAIVSYYFEMEYEMGGQTVQSNGRDLFALVYEDERWWIVSDQFSPYP